MREMFRLAEEPLGYQKRTVP